MLELRGKYNTAKVFTDNIDEETIAQIINLCNQDFPRKSNPHHVRLSCRDGM